MNINYITDLLLLGYNVMPINADKTPKQGWKKYQDVKINSLDEFRCSSDFYALICGFNDVEVIDVDLKILPAKVDRDKFWAALIQMLSDNIDDFNKRFCIKQTRSGGYHIIYRAKNIEGNLKLARLNIHDEAIIETRGIGGYVCMYDGLINFNYHDIQLIEDNERDIIISCCRTFNEHQDVPIQVDIKVEKQYKDKIDTLTPWEDYNNKTSIFDIISSDFDIVKNGSDKVLIRRHGAKSPHSGYVFKNSGCMYLFSTGTQYEAQKLITPFTAFAINKFNGDFSRAASFLYSQGYGDRKRPEPVKNKIIDEYVPPVDKIEFPIDIYPKEIVDYILECNKTLQNSIDYMGCAFLWMASLVVGNTLNIRVKNGWFENATVWISIVGPAGVGKSPSISSIIFPIEKINGEERRRYQRAKKEYDEYMALSKKEQKEVPEVQQPVRTQFIVDDVTIEALLNLHAQNPHGVGVFKDELAGWFKDMNKYKEGSDKEQWLSSWSGKGISVDRISRQSDYIARPLMPVLGGIQPLILSQFFTDENKDSGFLDRMLFASPDIEIEKYVDAELNNELLNYYNQWVLYFYKEARKFSHFDDNGDIMPINCKWSEDAKKEWIRIFNKITELQNSESTAEHLKSGLPKQKSYIPRFALLINTINGMNEGNQDLTTITKDSVLKAEKLSDYFIAMNEKMLQINIKSSAENKVMANVKSVSVHEKIKAIYESEGENFNKANVAKQLNISRKTLYKYIQQIKDGAKNVPN